MSDKKLLENATIDEIKTQLAILEEREKQKKISARNKECDKWLQEIDSLLAIIPHGRTSCSDEDPCNSYNNRCSRCTLLEFKKTGYWDNDYIVDIHLIKSPIG